jgi:hypothetical protein
MRGTYKVSFAKRLLYKASEERIKTLRLIINYLALEMNKL